MQAVELHLEVGLRLRSYHDCRWQRSDALGALLTKGTATVALPSTALGLELDDGAPDSVGQVSTTV